MQLASLTNMRAWVVVACVLTVMTTTYRLWPSGAGIDPSAQPVAAGLALQQEIQAPEPALKSNPGVQEQSSAGKDKEPTLVAQAMPENSQTNEDPLGWIPRRPELDASSRIWGGNPDNQDVQALEEQPGKTGNPAGNVLDDNESDSRETALPSVFSVALNDTGDETSGLASVSFTFTPMPGIQFVSNPTSISAQMFVYAHIQTTRNCASCVLMWEYQNSNEIEFLYPQSLSASQFKTVFITPENGWQVGSYALSVHDRDNGGEVIGRSTLTIRAISDELPSVVTPTDYIQSLLDSGQAVPKRF